MATYNNRHWLLSHIRNSFVGTDDTGMSENVMSEDMPEAFITRTMKTVPESYSSYMCYPGLDQSDDEDGFSVANSYDIQMNTDMGYSRQRSNTAHNLEKLKKARARASRVKTVKVESKAIPPLNDEEKEDLLHKREMANKRESSSEELKEIRSRLSEALLISPKQPQNKFIEYARFDGTSQTHGVATRTMQIFLTMLPEDKRNYPLSVCVSMNAKVQDFIGLICYKTTIANPEVPLKSVHNYGLYITEEDGEIEPDFPPLDVREPCSKFRFSHLALMERKNPIQPPPNANSSSTSSTGIHQQSNTGAYDFYRTLSVTSEPDQIRHPSSFASDDKVRRLNLQQQQTRDLATMNCHTTAMEAPLYRSYRVRMLLMTSLYKVEIQLGVSGEKIEIDPIQQKNSKLLWPSKQRAVAHKITSIAAAELVDVKTTRTVFRIIYKSDKSQGSNYDAEIDYRMTASTSVAGKPLPLISSTSPGTHSFKHYSFETDLKTAQEIVEKIKNILEVRSSVTRKEYLELETKPKRKSRTKKASI